MMRLRDTVRQVAQADVDVLVEGETGTGKELVALLLHRWSARRTRPFIAVDCAALPEAIAEDELFGQAHGRTPGRIAAANRGTLFLDEVDSMAPALQGRMLRVVEEREVRAIGAEDPQSLDLRIVAAAKSDLARAVEEGRFRADLLYRLDAVRLRVPPLRERRADVPLLFAHFLREAAERFGRPVPMIDGGIQARLLSHDWPGNVREVRNYANRVALGLFGETRDAGDPLPCQSASSSSRARRSAACWRRWQATSAPRWPSSASRARPLRQGCAARHRPERLSTQSRLTLRRARTSMTATTPIDGAGLGRMPWRMPQPVWQAMRAISRWFAGEGALPPS